MSLAIWWIRRDLRLMDNNALRLALAEGRAVLPVFILDPRLLERPAPKRQAFLFSGLRALDAELHKLGVMLVVRSGDPLEVLTQVCGESGAQVIFAEEDYSPYARRRDAQVAAQLPLRLAGGLTVHHPSKVCKPDGTPYTIFTPFSKAWKALGIPRSDELFYPSFLPQAPELASLPLPASEHLSEFPASEQEAQSRLASFLDGPMLGYQGNRNRMDLEQGTSQLSPYFRFGMLSVRQAAWEAWKVMQRAPDENGQHGAETWLNELIWREFYNTILFHFPHVLRIAFNPSLRKVSWRNAPDDLAAWQEGRTGYPIVDAGMRQLIQMGWIHNRARMVVASFLVKDLLIDWRAGERWFMQHLVDGDPAANNGGWQWTAGVGTDAAPYFRVFNPVLQSQRFDPQGKYIRRWVPELQLVPNEYIHEPWKMPGTVQRASQCRLGIEYPMPVVDHTVAKVRVLAVYRQSQQIVREEYGFQEPSYG